MVLGRGLQSGRAERKQIRVRTSGEIANRRYTSLPWDRLLWVVGSRAKPRRLCVLLEAATAETVHWQLWQNLSRALCNKPDLRRCRAASLPVPPSYQMPMSEIHKRISDSFSAQGLMVTIGAQLRLVADGEVQIELPFSSHLSQQHGYLHAGATTSILNSACGYAALTKAPPGF